MTWTLLEGDSAELLKSLPDNSVEACVTDPPAGIEFMGKEWDRFKDRKRSKGWAQGGKDGNDGFGGFAKTLRPAFCSQSRDDRENFIAWLAEVMTEVRRVLRPGGHALVWSLPRTSYWTAMALDEAGFEVRDVITHHFSQGFPKSHNVSKAIDRAAGAEREVVGRSARHGGGVAFAEGHSGFTPDKGVLTAPATDAAKQWAGWGSALKPATEFYWLVRKPLAEKNIAANVLAHGCGGLNIDATRIGTESAFIDRPGRKSRGGILNVTEEQRINSGGAGRYPSNLLLSHSPACTDQACHAKSCPVAELDRQSGVSASRASAGRNGSDTGEVFAFGRKHDLLRGHDDSGGASRFFATFRYVPKPAVSEKEDGCEDLGEGDGRRNIHPTPKSVALMSYLVKLITPPGGTCLDPFAGSGSTGVAAISEGFSFLGIEQDSAYCKIARARLARAEKRKRDAPLVIEGLEEEFLPLPPLAPPENLTLELDL